MQKRIVKTKTSTLRKTYKPGELGEADFCDGIPIYQGSKKIKTHLFALSLPFSSYVFARFVLSQKIKDFIEMHDLAYRFFGGGNPKYQIVDNLKSGVTKAHLYDPTVNEELYYH